VTGTTDAALALLREVAAGRAPATLRVARPPATVAFGKADTLRPGYPTARAAAERHGFAPVLRGPGGHAAAYDAGSVVFDLVVPAGSPLTGLHDLFEETSPRIADALRALGVDARVGAVPGEYCRGDWSVNARGAVKLCGTAQRRVRGAALLGGFVTVTGAARLRAVLADVYAALDIAWDPATLGAVSDEAPGAGVDEVAAAVRDALSAPGSWGAASP
jgi:lipoate-protein ligase A